MNSVFIGNRYSLISVLLPGPGQVFEVTHLDAAPSAWEALPPQKGRLVVGDEILVVISDNPMNEARSSFYKVSCLLNE